MLPLRIHRSTLAACLATLMCVMSTGLPTHHHHGVPDDTRGADVIEAGDHHSHATELVAQVDRIPVVVPQLTPLPARSFYVAIAKTVHSGAGDGDVPRPLERSPPPGSPRGPPHAS